MNRLDTLEFPPAESLSSLGAPTLTSTLSLDEAVGRISWPVELPPVATFSPVHYESGYAYPLVVWLHGAGQSKDDLAQVMAHISTRNYVAVAPEAVGDSSTPWPQQPGAIAEAEQRVLDAVDAAAMQFNVHPERVFVCGAGIGGTAALRAALARPDCFAGAASFDGGVPQGHAPLRSINSVRGLPLMLVSGRESDRYDERQVCSDLRLLYSAGCSLSLRQEPGDGDLTKSMLKELDRWMMNIVCGSGSASSR